MGFFDWKYLNEDQLKGFDNYKYSCIDTSPLAVYISHPFWDWFVKFYPKWLAPNLITLAGATFVMGCYAFVSIIDYNLTANSIDSPDNQNIRPWVWLLCSICTFMGHLLDGTDGKQARRTGASGPTGELFDHGLDSWATIPFTITIFSIFGRGGPYSVTPISLLGMLITVQTVFIVTHWEKYNTGVMFLSWGYDASQYGLCLFYLITYFVGHKAYQFYFYGLSFAQFVIIGFYATCIGSFIMSICNIYKAYFIDGTGKQSSFYECIRPLIAPFILFSTAVLWAKFSPTQVIDHDPRAFFWAMGVVFSNIAVHLIISQMACTRSQLFNKLLLVFFLIAGLSTLGVFGHFEIYVLRVFAIIFTLVHLHYGICVVRQLCDHFDIYVFSLSYLEKRNATEAHDPLLDSAQDSESDEIDLLPERTLTL